MGKQSCRKIMPFLFLAVISFLAVGCGGGGGGGGGEGLTAGGPGAAGAAGVWRMTASGFIDEKALPQPAPDKLEAPDRQEAPAIPGVGYSVRAINALTGQILATALSGADGFWKLTFATPKTSNMAVVLVAIKEKIILRALLPLKSADLFEVAQGGNFNITMQMAISQSTENVVQAVEMELGLTKGDFGKLTTFPGTITTASIIAKSEEHGFILQPSGFFTFIGQVDILDLTPAPTFSVAVTASSTSPGATFKAPVNYNPGINYPANPTIYNIPFDYTVNLKGAVTALTGSLAGRNLAYKWTQTAGVTGTIGGATALDTTFTTASETAALVNVQNYLNSAYPGTLPKADRLRVLPLTARNALTDFSYNLRLTVTDVDSGVSAYGNVVIQHFAKQTGLNNVPVGLPVLLNAPGTGPFSWTLGKPDGSVAILRASDTKNPYFIPDLSGTYTLTEATAGTLTVYAGNWTGIRAVASDDPAVSGIDISSNNGCLGACHGSSAGDLTEIFEGWSETVHAKLFKEELNRTDEGYEYNNAASCTTCHVVGNEPAANNGGWDDALAASTYKFPDFPNTKSTNYSEFVTKYQALAALSSIECETCHGPSNSEGHTVTAARITYDSALCAICHGRPAGHNRYYIWSQSAHSNSELAEGEATGSHGTNCGRCHSAQGFVAWLAVASDTTDVTLDASQVTWTEEDVQPITCAACHNLHSEQNANLLRITGNTKFLQAGFQATNVGKGALCMMCHNARRGEKHDGTAMTSTSSPHAAPQADMVMGKNAYFVDWKATDYRSPHATTALGANPKALQAMPDTCVTCHMDLVPANPPTTGTNHRFAITAAQVCAKCHGAGMNAIPLQNEIKDLLTALGNNIATRVYNTIKTKGILTVTGYPYDGNTAATWSSDATLISDTNISSVVFSESPSGFFLNLAAPQTFAKASTGESLTTNKVRVSIGNIKVDTTAVFTATTDPTVFKALYNYYLVVNDKSMGVHNRPFAKAMLQGAIANLP